MLGWQIFLHSVKMVLRNLKEALQISSVPALIGCVIIIALSVVFGISFEDISTEPNGFPDAASVGTVAGFMLSVFVTVFAIMFWIAVSWHRFVLLEEYPSGLLPEFRFDRIIAYFGRVVLLGVVMVLGYLPVIVALPLLSGSFEFALFAVYILFLIVCFYRWAPILPAAAIGQPISLGQAWNSTAGAGGAILVLMLAAVAFQFVVQFALALLAAIPVFGFLIGVFVGILVLPLINVSILTTMYGVFIEKRELA